MTDSDSSAETLKREAFAWLARLTSGEATAADGAAFERWRATSHTHQKAFSEAKLLWTVMGPAAEHALHQGSPMVPAVRVDHRLRRRAFLGGTVAASAASLVYLAARPPLGLWPSFAELNSDYRTSIGEQRRITLGNNVSVELNTQTSIAFRPAIHDMNRIELISGEAAIATGESLSKPLVVVAGEGQVTAHQAAFNLLHVGSVGCVTCLDGEVLVECPGAAVMLKPQQQVTYNAGGLGSPITIELSIVTAWQQGLLIFRHAPLSQVVDEVNRYRHGRIILTNEALRRRLLFASFRIDRIEDVVPKLEAVLGVQVRNFPGGVVLLS
jgi:transmembrane sensor